MQYDCGVAYHLFLLHVGRKIKFGAWNLVLCIVVVFSYDVLKPCRWFVDSGMLALRNINADFCCGR
jgi:hypothetical protein